MFSSNYVASSIPQTRQEWMEALQERFNFTAEDFTINQRGQYSEPQKAELEPIVGRAQRDPSCFTVLAGALLVGALGLILLNMALGGVIAAFLSLYPYGLIAALASAGFVLMLIISAFSTMRQRTSIDSMDKLVIEMAEGPASMRYSYGVMHMQTAALVPPRYFSYSSQRYREAIYRINIGDKTFYMPKSSAERFLSGAVYRVHYLRFVSGIVFLLSADLIQMP